METLGHLRTGSGDDVIRLAATLDPSYFSKTIETGPGDDMVIADARFSYINTPRTADHFDGGPGNDWLSFEQSIGPVTVNLSNGTTGQLAAPITHTNFENVIGTNFNDILIGDAGDNIFMPLLIDFIPNVHSYDNIFGGGGIDTLRIDYSSCPLVNEQGLSMNPNTYADINDTMGIALGPNYSVWAGQMMIYYLSIEKFELTGGNASDRFYGDAGFAGNDIFIGLGGNDYMEARRGDDYLDGGEGDDILNAGTGNDTVIGGPGNDTITFMYHLGPDNFYGHDICDAGPGDDIVSNLWLPNFTDTTATNETTIMQFDGGPGYDTLIADLGHMTQPLIWDDATPIDFDLPNGGYIRNFEHLRSIVLGNGDDHITLRGRHPVARRFGLRGGDDTLATSEGHINAYGGPGIDTLILDYRIGDEPGLSGVLREGSLIIRRRLADNVIIDTVRASIDYILPSECENLVLTGNAISGTGNYQANVLTGNAQSNILRGEGGSDILDGGGHLGTIDRLHGGPGADRFVLGTAGMRYYDDGNPTTPGHDSYAIIEDYTPTATSTSDRLQLAGSATEYLLGPSPFEETPGTALYHDSNGNGELDPESDELIAILQSAATLTPANTLTNAIYTQALAPAAVGITAPPTAHIVENPATARASPCNSISTKRSPPPPASTSKPAPTSALATHGSPSPANPATPHGLA